MYSTRNLTICTISNHPKKLTCSSSPAGLSLCVSACAQLVSLRRRSGVSSRPRHLMSRYPIWDVFSPMCRIAATSPDREVLCCKSPMCSITSVCVCAACGISKRILVLSNRINSIQWRSLIARRTSCCCRGAASSSSASTSLRSHRCGHCTRRVCLRSPARRLSGASGGTDPRIPRQRWL